MTFPFNFKIPAKDKTQANSKAAQLARIAGHDADKLEALAKLAGKFDAPTLKALAEKGPGIFSHPVYGGVVRSKLGL